MLYQILTHTPVYVWAILAFLVYRGMAALRGRLTTVRRLFIIPVVMLVLSLQDILMKFGSGLIVLAAWGGALAVVAVLVRSFGSDFISAGAVPGSLHIRGSRAPLLLMLGVFFSKYALSVTLAVKPGLVRDAGFVFAACAMLGVFSGYFVGRLLRDLAACRKLGAGRAAGSLAPAA